MPNYAFGRQQENKPTPGERAAEFGNALSTIYGQYKEGQAQEQAKVDQEQAIKTIQDPNASPIQQALAWTKVNPKVAEQIIKGQQQQQAVGQFFGGGQQSITGGGKNILPGGTERPDANQLRNAMQATSQEAPAQAQPQMNQAPTAQANAPMMQQPQAQPQQQSGSQLSNMSDDQLKEGIARFPQVAPALEQELKDRREARTAQQKEELFNKETERDIQKEERGRIREYSKPYENIQPLQKNLNDLEQAKKLILSDKVSFDENIFRGIVNAALEAKGKGEIAELLKTPAQQKLFSLLKNSLKTKEIGGSNPSTREVLISMAAIPSNLKGKESNLYIIDNMINDAKVNYEKGRIINQLSNNPNLRYGEFLEKVNSHVAPIQQKLEQEFDKTDMINSAKSTLSGRKPKQGYVFMLNPQTGEPREVLSRDVQGAQAAGGILLNE